MSADNLIRRQAQAQHVAPAALLVDEKTAAELLGGICTKHLYNLRRRGGLPFVRIGTRVFYRPADLSAWIDRQAQVHADASAGEGVDHE